METKASQHTWVPCSWSCRKSSSNGFSSHIVRLTLAISRPMYVRVNCFLAANEQLRRSVNTPPQAQVPAQVASTVTLPATSSSVSPSPRSPHTESSTTSATRLVQPSTASAVRQVQLPTTSAVQPARPSVVSAIQPVQPSMTSAVQPAQLPTVSVVQPVQPSTALPLQSTQSGVTLVIQPIQSVATPAVQPVQSSTTLTAQPVQPSTAIVAQPVQPSPTSVARPLPDSVNDEPVLTNPAARNPGQGPAVMDLGPDTMAPLPTLDHGHPTQNDLSASIPIGPCPKFLTPKIVSHLSGAANMGGWSDLVKLYLEFEIASPSRSVSGLLVLYIVVSNYSIGHSSPTRRAAG